MQTERIISFQRCEYSVPSILYRHRFRTIDIRNESGDFNKTIGYIAAIMLLLPKCYSGGLWIIEFSLKSCDD